MSEEQTALEKVKAFVASYPGADVLAGLAIDLLTQPELLTRAKAEHAKKTSCGYVCPIPPEAVPTAL